MVDSIPVPHGQDGTPSCEGLGAMGFDWMPATSALHAADQGVDLRDDDPPRDDADRIRYGGDYGRTSFGVIR